MKDKFAAKGLDATIESVCKANGRRLTGGASETVTFEYTAKIVVEGTADANGDKMRGMLDQLKEISADPTSLTTDFVNKYREKKLAEDASWTEPDWVNTIEIKDFVVPEKVEVVDSTGTQLSLTDSEIDSLLQEEEDGALGQFPGLLVSSLLLSMAFAHLG